MVRMGPFVGADGKQRWGVELVESADQQEIGAEGGGDEFVDEPIDRFVDDEV